MSSGAPSPSLRNLFSELEQLFQTETEARVSTSVQAAVRTLAEHLNQSVRRLRQAAGFSEIAAILCDASAPFAKICAVFEVSEGEMRAERMRGARDDAAAGFDALRFAVSDAGAFAGAIESREPVVALGSASEVSSALVELFGHVPGEKAYLFPLTAEQSTAGVLYASGNVESAALELLTQAAAAILEAQQRAVLRPAPAEPAKDLIRIETAAPVNPPAAAPALDWDALSLADRRLHLRAQRFARVQVAEMRLYRPEAVEGGRAQGDLYAALQEPIDTARQVFRETFVAVSPSMVDYLHRELLRLANENPAGLGEKYPGPLV